MKCSALMSLIASLWSPLAEGRELKLFGENDIAEIETSPLAEGRELKYLAGCQNLVLRKSPLAEGRELKYYMLFFFPIPFRVAPRGGA